MNQIRVRLVIEGRVQGVWFRDSTRREASRLGVLGWVRNRTDGSVEVLAEGDPDHVKQLVAWCHQGPPGARVSNVMAITEQYTGEYTGFLVKHWSW